MVESAPIDKEAYLRTHLEKRYSVSVVDLTRLDKGVFGVHLGDGRRWIVRVFPERRSVEHVNGDAEVLQFLAQQDFPAERCADPDPVSVLHGRGILVTEYIEGANVGVSGHTLKALGAMLGRLHSAPAAQGAVARAAGALHHYAPDGGGPQAELLAANSWLAAIEDRIPAERRAPFDFLRERLASADICQNLPQALIHPDPVLKNVLVREDGAPVLIDWTGAGWGPRLISFAVLVWSCALKQDGWSPQRVDAVVNGYRAHITLDEDELARLAEVLRIRPLVFACWRYRAAVRAGKLPDGAEWWRPDDELPEQIAARVRAVLK